MVDNKSEPWDNSESSAVVKEFFDYEYFNLMTPFIVSLVIYFVEYRFKLLRMYWCKCMTPFREAHLLSDKEIFVYIS